MVLENITLPNNITNLNSIINDSSELVNLIISNLIEKIRPFLAIMGGILGLYILYLIIKTISDTLLKRRIKRIDKNVKEIKQNIKEIKEKITGKRKTSRKDKERKARKQKKKVI